MKKIILLLTMSLFLLTGCGSSTKTLTCTTNGEFHGAQADATVRLKIRNQELIDATMDFDIAVDENERANYLSYYRQNYSKMQSVETSTGIRLSAGMDSEYFDALRLTKEINYNEVKQLMEQQGYICK